MKKFFVKTLGCKTNQLESEIIIQNLSKSGFALTDKAEEADFYILNSCAVTQNAVWQSLYYLKNIKHKKPDIKTILTGCTAQLREFDEKNVYEFVDLILGNNEKLDIEKFFQFSQKCFADDIFKLKEFNNKFIDSCTKTRANLKIQDGCNNRCSYCTIPFARGVSRSNSVENILKQIDIYAQNDIKEIILTGIHIGQWGWDFEKKLSLKNLLEEIEKTDIARYRLGSLDTTEINDELLDFLKNSKKFCPHFHISIQSMSDDVLKSMNRKYSARQTLDVIEKINSLFDKPFIGCDVIVGFNGESEENFRECFENLKKAQLSKIHVFPYSMRKNTLACKMGNKVDEETKKARATLLKNLSSEKFETFLKANLNTIQEVQVQKHADKKTGLFKGTTRNYIDVLIDCEKDITNRLVLAKLTKLENETMTAQVIQELS